MKEEFLKIKPSAVLLLLKDSQQQWYPSKLARLANCSYVHTVNLLSRLRKYGIVALEKKGRQSIYKLTDRGLQLAALLDDFSKKCDLAEAESKAKPEEKT
jgi:predicted transcriptional regulator